MQKRSTSTLCLIAGLLLSACTNVPAPVDADDRAERVEQIPRAEATGMPVAAHQLDAVPIPPLQPGIRMLFERALQLMRQQQYQAAEELFTELTVRQPELAGPWVNLGYIHLALGQTESARENFEQALAANPRNCDAHNQLGVMARRAGRFAQAEQHYLDCLAGNPGYAAARLNQGILYELYMGRLGEALAAYYDYQAALLTPDNRVDGWVMDLERRVAAIAKR